MKKAITSLALVLALTGGSAPAAAHKSKLKEKAEMAKAATVDLAAAVGKATAKVPGKAVEVELAKKKGKTVWEVEVLNEKGEVQEVDVDVASGDVLDTEAQKK